MSESSALGLDRPGAEAEVAPTLDGELTDRRRWIALVVLCVGQLMIVLDTTIVNVALPAIQSELHFSTASLAWVVDAYLIGFGGFLLVAGRIADTRGRKKTFLWGVALFTLTSVWCGLSGSAAMLVIARFAQGISAAFVAASVLGIILAEFPKDDERIRALGVFGFVGVGGGALGLICGGAITEALSWHWIFFINAPIGAATVVAGSLLVKETGSRDHGGRTSIAGAALITAAMMLAVYAIAQTSTNGWTSARTLLMAVGACVLIAIFAGNEAFAAIPLLPRWTWRSRPLMVGNLMRGFFSAAMIGQYFLTILYLQRVHGFDAFHAGISYLPQATTIAFFSLFATRRVMGMIGAKATLLTGLLLMVAGLAYFSRLPTDGSYPTDVLPPVWIIGVGAGLAFTPSFTLAASGAAQRDAGVVSATINVTQQMFSALGIAVLASISTTRTHTLLAEGSNQGSALTAGYRLGYLATVGCLVLAIVITAVWVHERASAAELDAGELPST